jgi:glucosamine-6-phosphate deaminase
MQIVIDDDLTALTARAGDEFAHLIARKPAAVLGLATGSSPLPLYAELERRVDAGLDLRAVSGFALDEYVGIPLDHPQSYHEVIRTQVTGPLGLDPARVHVPDGLAADLAAACADYERAIAAAGGVDIQILGIGGNGHIGFNEPGSPLDSRTRVVTLAERTRSDNARFFDSIDQVPTRSVTQGIGTILQARHLLLLAQGERKAAAVAAAVEGPVTPDHPASALQLHDHVTLLLDTAAASQLTREALAARA